MMPSLSVVHTDPSRRRNDAPADSSPPKPMVPPIRPSTNHLNPTGTSTNLRPIPAIDPPCRVAQRMDAVQLEVVPVGDGGPVADAGPAERIGADPDPLLVDDVDVDHVRQVLNVGVHVVVALGALQRPSQRHPLYA